MTAPGDRARGRRQALLADPGAQPPALAAARSASTGREMWALRDVDLRIEPGETVGMVGRNGAGQDDAAADPRRRRAADRRAPSPCAGGSRRCSAWASGFHQEMTGRENVYVNAMLLGLKKRGIDRLFDDIVDFADLARLHRHAGEVLLVRHVHAARLLGRDPRRPDRAPRRRDPRRRRRRLPAALLRPHARAAARRHDHRVREPLDERGPPALPAGAVPAQGSGRSSTGRPRLRSPSSTSVSPVRRRGGRGTRRSASSTASSRPWTARRSRWSTRSSRCATAPRCASSGRSTAPR